MSTPAYPKSLAEALVALQSQLPKIEKASEARVQTKQGSYSYRYADLSQLTEIIMPLLARVGLAFTAKPRIAEGGAFVLEYSLIHVSGEREVGQYPLPTGGSPQAIGSAITYGRRYCLCAVTGVAPEGGDDGAAAEAEAAANRGTARRATRPRAGASQQARRAQVAAPTAAVPARSGGLLRSAGGNGVLQSGFAGSRRPRDRASMVRDFVCLECGGS